MQMELVQKTFNEICGIWSKELWPGRQSTIEELSYLTPAAQIDMNIGKYQAEFLAVEDKGKILGVIGGHPTSDTEYRFRGVWVHPDHRKKGIATQMILAMAEVAREKSFSTFWGMPRVSSWPIYEKLNFQVDRETTQFEFGPHFIVTKKLK